MSTTRVRSPFAMPALRRSASMRPGEMVSKGEEGVAGADVAEVGAVAAPTAVPLVAPPPPLDDDDVAA